MSQNDWNDGPFKWDDHFEEGDHDLFSARNFQADIGTIKGKQMDEFQNGARHMAHFQMNTLSEYERDNLMENLILIVGFERFKKACNMITGEETLLTLAGKEVE